MHRFKNPNEILAGGFLIAMAILAFALSWRLSTGTANAMGPGYLPRMLCFIQLGLGLAIILTDVAGEESPLEAWFPRPLFWILLSVGFFGFSIERLGLFLSVVGLVLISSLGYRDTKPLPIIALALGMASFSVLTFVTALGLPIPITPVVH